MVKRVTERVKALHARRAEAKVCRKQRKSDEPHGPIFRADMCEPCYSAQLAYNAKLKRDLRRRKRREGQG